MSSRWILFFAVPEEARPFLDLRARRGIAPIPLSPPIPGALGWRVGPGDIWVTGMGRRKALAVAEAVLTEEIEWVVTSGFAGGLDPALATGTIVHELDPGFPLRLPSNPQICAGRFHLAESVAASAAAKAALRSATGTDAVDMESQAIRDLCGIRGVASATIRVISDAANEDLPLDFGALMTPDQRIDFPKLAWTLLKSPGKIPSLIGFSRRLGRASTALATTLDRMIEDQSSASATG